MKVLIGKYKYDWDTYRLLTWLRPVVKSRVKYNNIVEKVDKYLPFVQPMLDVVNRFNKSIHYVRIEDHDLWSADTTLAYIILPVLKKLNKQKRGAPSVDDEDVPENIRSNVAPAGNEYDVDKNHFNRWDWVMNEMIWAFEQIVDDRALDKFFKGDNDLDFVETENGLFQLVKGDKHTREFDKEGYVKHDERINNGLRLFGKYYRGLWD